MIEVRIILPRINITDNEYKVIIDAFTNKISKCNITIANEPNHYPEYYYFSEMANVCMTSSERLDTYIRFYKEVCSELSKNKDIEKTAVEYIEYSFYIYAIREIHVEERADEFKSVLETLEIMIDENRTSFEGNRFASKFETRWCNRYVNIGANFHLSFLVPITLRCNKLCKYCMVFSPYFELEKRVYHPSFEDLCRQIDTLFEIVDSSHGIQFAGGEPCVRNDLPALIDYVGDHYKDRISEFTRQGTGFGIITNSTIDFSDELIEASRRFGSKLYWLLDDYRFSKVDQIIRKLKDNEINYMYRDQKTVGNLHCDGWINTLNDYSLPIDPEAATNAVKSCGQKQLIFQFIVANGKMYPCSRVMASDLYWPNMEISREYSVDMYDENTTKEDKIKKIKNLLCLNYFHTCDKCKGMHEKRKRYYPAEQLTANEIIGIRTGHIKMTDFGNYDEKIRN